MTIDTGFRPSVHGLPFANNIAKVGECGGFVDYAKKLFLAGKPVPTKPPRFRLFWRQVMSLFGNTSRVFWWTMKDDLTLQLNSPHQMTILRGLLLEGPVPLMLIYGRTATEVAEDHQVLAYAIIDDVVMVYDPNQPKDDTVTLPSMGARGWYCR